MKILKVGPKRHFLSIFRLKFEKAALNFSICEDSGKNKKYLHLGQKLLYLGIFGLEFEKAIILFEINAPKFV